MAELREERRAKRKQSGLALKKIETERAQVRLLIEQAKHFLDMETRHDKASTRLRQGFEPTSNMPPLER
jgi:hypothetical protein